MEELIRLRLHYSKLEADPNGIAAGTKGAKLDNGKIQMDILEGFSLALLAVADVGTYGAIKYSKGGWKEVSDPIPRYTSAMLGHYFKEPFEKCCPHTGLLHAAQLAWNALARLDKMVEEDINYKAQLLERVSTIMLQQLDVTEGIAEDDHLKSFGCDVGDAITAMKALGDTGINTRSTDASAVAKPLCAPLQEVGGGESAPVREFITHPKPAYVVSHRLSEEETEEALISGGCGKTEARLVMNHLVNARVTAFR